MLLHLNIISKLASESKAKLMRFILTGALRVTGRELARMSGVSHSTTIEILKEFEEINLVRHVNAGKSVVWGVNTESYAFFVAKRLYGEKEWYRPVEHLKKTLVSGLPKKLVKRAVLFGSVCEGTEKRGSDIDLFVLVEGQKEKKKMEKILFDLTMKCSDLYANTLSYYMLTENEYNERRKLALISNIEKGIKLI